MSALRIKLIRWASRYFTLGELKAMVDAFPVIPDEVKGEYVWSYPLDALTLRRAILSAKQEEVDWDTMSPVDVLGWNKQEVEYPPVVVPQREKPDLVI